MIKLLLLCLVVIGIVLGLILAFPEGGLIIPTLFLVMVFLAGGIYLTTVTERKNNDN